MRFYGLQVPPGESLDELPYEYEKTHHAEMDRFPVEHTVSEHRSTIGKGRNGPKDGIRASLRFKTKNSRGQDTIILRNRILTEELCFRLMDSTLYNLEDVWQDTLTKRPYCMEYVDMTYACIKYLALPDHAAKPLLKGWRAQDERDRCTVTIPCSRKDGNSQIQIAYHRTDGLYGFSVQAEWLPDPVTDCRIKAEDLMALTGRCLGYCLELG